MLDSSGLRAKAKRFLAACLVKVRADGGGAVVFVVAMLGLNVMLIIGGGVLSVMGDDKLIDAVGRASEIITPAMGAATAILAVVNRMTRA